MELLLNENNQKRFFAWLKIFTAICVFHSVIILIFCQNQWMYYFVIYAMIAPFVHGIVFAMGLNIYAAIHFNKGTSMEYIQEKHPEIWYKISKHGAWGAHYTIASFVKGKYDDGKDKRLNEIKHRLQKTRWMVAWSFFLIFGSWMLNIFAIILRSYK
ncbi:MAG: hypothetical protein ACMUJM_20690 [bacterium]